MRNRVFLKSPLRGDRTPGSVRGLWGAWQFCRDGHNGELRMAEVTIREAVRGDLEAILGLYAELDEGQSLGLRDAERVFERIRSYPDYTIYVAELAGEIVGAFELLIMDNLAHLGAPSGVIEDVVVGSQWRRQGIGRGMVQHALRLCRRAGCYKLALSSNLERKSAHEFYESLGFQRHGYSFLISLEL